jgi:iron complex outermembrane receptor protein
MRFMFVLAASTYLVAASAVAEEPVAAGEASSAKSEAETSDALPRVIVTARRRTEDLQSVPTAISVVTGELLDKSYTVNTAGLSQLVPALYYNSSNPRNTAYTIRGLGSNTLSISSANDGIEPGVGFYVDQVYHGRPATAAFDFADLDQIEVLRGPQGTLFGKNTTGGAISVTSRLPTFTPEATGEVSYGDFNFAQAKATISGPLLGNQLAGRLSALYTTRDGLLHDVTTGKDLNALNNYAVKGQLLVKLADSLQVRLIGDVSNLDSDCCTQNFLRVGQSLRPPARQYPALAAHFGYAPPSTNIYDRLTDVDSPVHINTQDGGAAAIIDWSLGAAALTSVSAWRYWEWDVANDRDYTGLPIQTVQRIPSRQDQYSEELRLASKGDGPFHYVTGLYWFRQQISGTPISVYGADAAYWLIGATTGAASTPVPANLLDGYAQTGTSAFRVQSSAAFGEVNYDLTSRLTATLGLRYTYEEKHGAYATTVSGGLATTPGSALANAKLSIFRPQSYTASDHDGSPSGRANLAYKLSDDLFTYVSYAHGFKSGGINMSGLPLNAQNQPVLATAVIKPEENTTYEAGLKAGLFGQRVTLNTAAYWTVVDDYQATVVSSAETAALRAYAANIPQVRVRGVEEDAAARVTSGLTLRASVAYADGKYTNYPQGPCPLELQTATTAFCSFTGNRMAGLSRWSETLGADYEIPLGSGAVVLHADSSFRSGYYGDATESKYTWINGYNVTNASIGYRGSGGVWEVDVFARNLLDRNYVQALTIQTGNSGLILGQPSDPRLVGGTVRVKL